MRTWTLAFEDELRRHVFEGQVCLEELLADDDRGDLEPPDQEPTAERPVI